MSKTEKFFAILFLGFIFLALYYGASVISEQVRTILVFAGVH